jgi:Flp pilus assembly protein TadD
MDADTCYKNALLLQRASKDDEALKAFEAAIALAPGYAEAYNARGISLFKLDRAEDALASFQRALDLNPAYAECHNNRGIVLHEMGRLDAALASFDKAVALKPDNARAHNNRGAVLGDLKHAHDALLSYDKAIALDPAYAEAFYNRGLALHDLGRFSAALASFDRAIALRPDYAEAHHNRGTVLQDLQSLEDAIRAYAAAAALRPDRAESHANQAYCYLQLGRFEPGWRLHEWRKRLPAPVGNRSFPRPLWLGREDISNRILFVHWEQGFGDTIQFCRYGKLLKAKGANVVMSVQEPLYRLLKQMSPEVEIIHQTEVPARFDYHCPMMSLPLALGTTLATIPAEPRYLLADAALRTGFEARLPPKTRPRIGLAWRGSATHKNDHYRSIDLEGLAPLLSADSHWISVLYGAGPSGQDAVWPSELVSCADAWVDFADAAALIDCLDLVITVDTSVAHLAGALGKPVFVLLPFNADWRWLLERDDSPWYPSARLFRQRPGESWTEVIARVRDVLTRFVRPGA